MTDKEFIKFTTGFRKGLLGKRKSEQMCFMVCAPLQGLLSVGGIETKLIGGEIENEHGIFNHFWLQLPDGRILDATADQFKTPEGKEMPKVFIGYKPEWYKLIGEL